MINIWIIAHLFVILHPYLAPLVECSLYHALKQLLVASQVGNLITRHADYCALHLWWRIEHTWLYSKQILYVVPRLYQYR